MSPSKHSDAAQSAPSISRREILARYIDSVTAVIAEYGRIKQLSPVIACDPDPEPIKRPQKLTYDLIDYGVDIERATEQALANRPDLQAAWFDLALGKPVKASVENELVWKCGRLYHARNLEPWRYWRTSLRRNRQCPQ